VHVRAVRSPRWGRWPTACCARRGWRTDDTEVTIFGVSVAETRAFALRALERRMKVIGLLDAA
jgi:hypothetical protein